MKRIVFSVLVLLFATNCAITGGPAPETAREKYTAAETAFKAVVTTVDQLARNGTVKKGSSAALTLASSIRTARTALDVWAELPDDVSRQQAALIALSSVQDLLINYQTQRAKR